MGRTGLRLWRAPYSSEIRKRYTAMCFGSSSTSSTPLGAASRSDSALVSPWVPKLVWVGMYHNGLGVAQSNREAVRWYRKAAEQGDEIAQSNLAAMGY